MKEKLKYLTAVLLAGSIAVWFLPLISISVVDLSVMDIMKTGLGFYGGSAEAEMIYGSIRTYLEPYAWCIVGALVVILIEAFLTAILSGKKAYVVSLVSCIINCAAMTAVFVLIRIQLDEVQSALILLEAADLILLHTLPLILWGVIYLIILVLSIVGICLWASASRKETKSEDIYIDQIRMLEEENAVSQHTDKLNAAPYRPSQQPAEETVPPVSPIQPAGNTEQQYRPVQQIERTGRQEMPETPAYGKETAEHFEGAIVGEAGMYAGKVYSLTEMKEVFFREEEDQIVLSPYEEEGNMAGVYFIGDYNEYCVEPYEKSAVFLESGQPLGKGRKYYLPRGTRVYVKDKNNQFTLA